MELLRKDPDYPKVLSFCSFLALPYYSAFNCKLGSHTTLVISGSILNLQTVARMMRYAAFAIRRSSNR
jgi:hypothetical protein